MLPPDCTGTRNGSAASAATPSTPGRRANSHASAPIAASPTAAAASASAPRSRTDSICGEFQISATSSTGVSTARRASPTPARARCAPSTAPAASAAATHHARDQHAVAEGRRIAHRDGPDPRLDAAQDVDDVARHLAHVGIVRGAAATPAARRG